MDGKLKLEIKKIIKEDYIQNKNQIPWDGMHDDAVKKIEKLIEKNENKA
jgi:CTP:phosphocholine cytidylyltransferase-like protein